MKRELLAACQGILAEYGQRITLRQLYYRLVAAQVIPNSAKYNRLKGNTANWRKAGKLDPHAFCDLTREPHEWAMWPNLKQRLGYIHYRRDRWQTHDERPEVWLEKEALATVFQPVCERFGVTLQVCRGYPSISALCDAAARLEGPILYFGDFDSSGVDIPRSVGDELRTWGGGADVDVIALTPEQINAHQLPAAPPKPRDSRTRRFLAEHGNGTVELDALPPSALTALIEEAISARIDFEAWNHEAEIERRELAELRRFEAAYESAEDDGGE